MGFSYPGNSKKIEVLKDLNETLKAVWLVFGAKKAISQLISIKIKVYWISKIYLSGVGHQNRVDI